MKRRNKIIMLICVPLLVIICATLLVYYFGATYPDFNKVATKSFNIPGLETNFVPQGIDYYKKEDKFLIAGYMSDNSASRIYVLNSNGEVEKYITLKDDDNAYCGHSGGIATHENTAWLVGDKKLYKFSMLEVMSCTNTESVSIESVFETTNGCDFVAVNENKLIVGEFYRENAYETDQSHHIKTANGTNYAISFVYNINSAKENGIDETPILAISMPNQVQGMSFTKNGNIILSTSYSIPSSKLFVYENVLNTETTKTINVNEVDIPLAVLDETNLKQTIYAPAMSEEMTSKDGEVYILFESACKKYKFVNRTRTKTVYKLDI